MLILGHSWIKKKSGCGKTALERDFLGANMPGKIKGLFAGKSKSLSEPDSLPPIRLQDH